MDFCKIADSTNQFLAWILDRRTFLKTGVAGFGSIMLMPSCLRQTSPYLFFTPEEARCVIALCEQIIPADEYGGGATEAGVIHYIDRQLVAVFDYDQVIYQQGLAASAAIVPGSPWQAFRITGFGNHSSDS